MKQPLTIALAACLSVAALTACATQTTTPSDPVFPVSVALETSEQLQFGMTIGILMGPLDGEGSEYRKVVNGAKVASFRFELGGLPVNFSVAHDDGTAEGAKHAIETLITSDVAGVIVAGAGPHLSDALAAAAAANLPTLLPYDYANQAKGPVYHTGPDSAALATGMKRALSAAKISRPVVVQQEGYELDGLAGIDDEPLAYAGDPALIARVILRQIDDSLADAAVIEASAQAQAAIVTHLQTELGDKQLPIILTPQALTPAFSDGLGPVADLRSVMISVGQNTDDTVALQPGDKGDEMSAFLQAVRMAADSSTTTNIYGDDTFASAASYADTASHDAVVALVRAAEAVAEGKSASIAEAFAAGLTLSSQNGLVGAPLNFSSTSALNEGNVVTLYASSQGAGLRPAQGDKTTPLTWVAAK